MCLPGIGHDSEYFLRLHNLPHGHRDSLRWHCRKILEPSFSHLLEPASFVEVDHDESLFGFEIRRWIVESEMAVLADANERYVDRSGTQEFARLWTDPNLGFP